MLRGFGSKGSAFAGAAPHRGVKGPAAPEQEQDADTAQRSAGLSATLVLASADCAGVAQCSVSTRTARKVALGKRAAAHAPRQGALEQATTRARLLRRQRLRRPAQGVLRPTWRPPRREEGAIRAGSKRRVCLRVGFRGHHR